MGSRRLVGQLTRSFDLLKEEFSTAGNITLSLGSRKEKMFAGSADIAAPKIWALSNDNIALRLTAKFTIAGGLHAQTFPAAFKMSDARWNSVTNVWTPEETGEFELTATFDGTNWNARIFGPFS